MGTRSFCFDVYAWLSQRTYLIPSVSLGPRSALGNKAIGGNLESGGSISTTSYLFITGACYWGLGWGNPVYLSSRCMRNLPGQKDLLIPNGVRFYAFWEFSSLVFEWEVRRLWQLTLSRSVWFVGTLMLQQGRKQTKPFFHNGLTSKNALIFRLRLSFTLQ